MGFSAPKPDPKIAQMQEQQAAEAKRNKISMIQGQLENEDQIRARLYGAKRQSMIAPGTSDWFGSIPQFGRAPTGQDPAVTNGLRGLAYALMTHKLP